MLKAEVQMIAKWRKEAEENSYFELTCVETNSQVSRLNFGMKDLEDLGLCNYNMKIKYLKFASIEEQVGICLLSAKKSLFFKLERMI